MALGDLLITIDDVRGYRDVDISYSTERFNSFLKDVQENELKDLLGDALWLDFFKNITDAKYIDLLNGKEYTYNNQTILYQGLKPFLCWAWLLKLPLEGNNHHTQSGDFAYIHDTVSRPSKYEVMQVTESYKSSKIVQRNGVIRFLNENSQDYALWASSYENNSSDLAFDFI